MDAKLSARELKTAQTKDAIIESARDLFERRGFEATTLEQIAAGAGVHRQTVLRHFETKEEIALSIRITSFDSFVAALNDPSREISVIECWRNHIRVSAESVAKRRSLSRYHNFIRSDPRLFGRWLMLEVKFEEELERALAAEAGTDPFDDFEGQMVAALLVAGNRRVAGEIFASGAMEKLAQACLAVVDCTAARFAERLSKRAPAAFIRQAGAHSG